MFEKSLASSKIFGISENVSILRILIYATYVHFSKQKLEFQRMILFFRINQNFSKCSDFYDFLNISKIVHVYFKKCNNNFLFIFQKKCLCFRNIFTVKKFMQFLKSVSLLINENTNAHTCDTIATCPHAWIAIHLNLHES